MSCPICNNIELQEGAESCNKCGSDLEVFTHIEAAHKEHVFQKKSILILVAVLGVVMVSWGSVSLFSGKSTEASTAIADTTMVSMATPDADANLTSSGWQKENEYLKSTIASLNEEIAILKKPVYTPKAVAPKAKKEKKIKKEKAHAEPKAEPAAESNSNAESGVIIHTVKKGQSFWTISKKYFKNGSHAKQIAADNNLTGVKNIPLGTKLKINK